MKKKRTELSHDAKIAKMIGENVREMCRDYEIDFLLLMHTRSPEYFHRYNGGNANCFPFFIAHHISDFCEWNNLDVSDFLEKIKDLTKYITLFHEI